MKKRVYAGSGSHKFMLKPSKPDPRDLKVAASRLAAALPRADLTALNPPAYDQGQAGLCFSHAGARCFDTEYFTHVRKFMTPSRLFLGIMTRSDEGTLNQDAGATLRGTVKAMVKYGICPESKCPYDVTKMFKLPTKALMTAAEKFQVIKYYSIANGDLETMRRALSSGYDVMFGARIFTSFESDKVARTGILPMPAASEGSLGGHALTCLGFDDSKRMFLVMNSWSEKWGLKGAFWMPYAYFEARLGLVFDLWVVSQTEIGV